MSFKIQNSKFRIDPGFLVAGKKIAGQLGSTGRFSSAGWSIAQLDPVSVPAPRAGGLGTAHVPTPSLGRMTYCSAIHTTKKPMIISASFMKFFLLVMCIQRY